jgi:hypothetical protein
MLSSKFTGKEAEKLGLEGIMAKRADSLYLSDLSGTRSADWLKIKTARRQEVVIVGFPILSPPKHHPMTSFPTVNQFACGEPLIHFSARIVIVQNPQHSLLRFLILYVIGSLAHKGRPRNRCEAGHE